MLVLFDIDGTLLHSGGCGRAATRLALQETFGTVGALDEVNFAGKTDWQILLEVLGPVGVSAQHIQDSLARHNEAVARQLAQIIHEFPVRPCIGAPDVATRDEPGCTPRFWSGPELSKASSHSTSCMTVGSDWQRASQECLWCHHHLQTA